MNESCLGMARGILTPGLPVAKQVGIPQKNQAGVTNCI
jgi:hypothetical protein